MRADHPSYRRPRGHGPGGRQRAASVTASAVYRSDGHVVGDETWWTGDDAAEIVRDALCGLVSGDAREERAMSTIFLDPVQMDATAGHVGEHVNELTALRCGPRDRRLAAVPAEHRRLAGRASSATSPSPCGWSPCCTRSRPWTRRSGPSRSRPTSPWRPPPRRSPDQPTFTDAPLVGGGRPRVRPTRWHACRPGRSAYLGQGTRASSLGASGPEHSAGGSTLGSGGRIVGSSHLRHPRLHQHQQDVLSTPGRTYLGNNIYSGSGMTGAFGYVLPDPGHDTAARARPQLHESEDQ